MNTESAVGTAQATITPCRPAQDGRTAPVEQTVAVEPVDMAVAGLASVASGTFAKRFISRNLTESDEGINSK